MKTKPFLILLITLIVARLVTMVTTPVFDPSESRYAVMAANMCRTGDFVVPHFTYEGYYQSFDGKPPLVFQAGGLFCKLFGVNELSVRLFPFLTAILLGFILYHTIKRVSGEAEKARLAVILYASCAAFYATAGFAMTDGPLAVSVAGALLLYWCFTLQYELKYALGVAVLLGAGMIIKGPVSFVLFGFPVFIDACLNRRWKAVFNIKWLYVLPVALLIAVPWFILVEQRNPGAVEYFFVNENFKRFLVHEYGDKYGAGRETFRGMAIVWTFVATLPWAFVPVVDYFKSRVKPNVRLFPVIGVAAITFFWCLTSRTLLSYLLPVAPLFAAALALVDRKWNFAKCVTAIVPIVVMTVFVISGAAAQTSDRMRGADAPDLYGFSNRFSHEFYHGTSQECVDASTDRKVLLYKALTRQYELEHGTK